MAPIRLLYIDDDAGLGRLLQKALVGSADVRHVLTGQQALELLTTANHGFEVIALDHNLIGETGLDLLPKIQILEGAPPVVYVTGSEDARVAVAALKAGAVDYVWKDTQGHYRELLRQAIGSAIEQTKLRREKEEAQRLVQEGKARAELLLHEVNHRVANSLALVASMARMQANAVKDAAAQDALLEMQTRVLAIAGVHRKLYTSSDVSVVDLGSYMDGLLTEIATALNAGGRYTFKIDVERGLAVTPDKAVSVGVIVTELVTNAVKYAYPEGGNGEVRICAKREGGSDQIRLIVEDDGVGWMGSGKILGTGVGTKIARAIASGLHTQVEYERKALGTRAMLLFDR